MGVTEDRPDGLIRVYAACGATAVVLSVGALVHGGIRPASSVAIGGIVAIFNLAVLARVVIRVAVPNAGAENIRALWGVLAIGKMMGLFMGVWVLMAEHLVDPLPLLVGYGSLPIGIVLGTLLPRA